MRINKRKKRRDLPRMTEHQIARESRDGEMALVAYRLIDNWSLKYGNWIVFDVDDDSVRFGIEIHKDFTRTDVALILDYIIESYIKGAAVKK